MPESHPLPDELQGGAFTRRTARSAGVNAARLRRRDIRRPFHGVHIIRSLDSLEERCQAYRVRMRPGQAFSHGTAVLLHGLPLPQALRTSSTSTSAR